MAPLKRPVYATCVHDCRSDQRPQQGKQDSVHSSLLPISEGQTSAISVGFRCFLTIVIRKPKPARPEDRQHDQSNHRKEDRQVPIVGIPGITCDAQCYSYDETTADARSYFFGVQQRKTCREKQRRERPNLVGNSMHCSASPKVRHGRHPRADEKRAKQSGILPPQPSSAIPARRRMRVRPQNTK